MTEKARSFRHKQVRMQGVLPGLRQQNRLTAAIHRAVARRLSAKTLAQPYVNSLFPLQTQSNPICMTPCPYKVICMKGRMQKCNSAAAAFCRSLGLHLSTAVFRGSATVPGTVFISYRAANHVYLNHKAHERARYAGACKVHMLKAATALKAGLAPSLPHSDVFSMCVECSCSFRKVLQHRQGLLPGNCFGPRQRVGHTETCKKESARMT